MNVKRLIIAGIAASVLFLVLDAALGMAGGFIGAQVFDLPFEQTPGIEAKVKFGLIFELINGFMLAVIYAVIHPSLPGQGWKKGIGYGLLVWGLRVMMGAFSTYMMTDMSPVLIAITVVTGLIEVMILCIVIAAIYRAGERNAQNVFPEPIRNLPEADIPLKGVKAYLSQSENHQIIFMEFDEDVELPEHSHAAQVGIVLEGKIDLVIDGQKLTYTKGDRYYIPEGFRHSGRIYAGYADITFFEEPDRYQAI